VRTFFCGVATAAWAERGPGELGDVKRFHSSFSGEYRYVSLLRGWA
jgi:hypothetical protein